MLSLPHGCIFSFPLFSSTLLVQPSVSFGWTSPLLESKVTCSFPDAVLCFANVIYLSRFGTLPVLRGQIWMPTRDTLMLALLLASRFISKEIPSCNTNLRVSLRSLQRTV